MVLPSSSIILIQLLLLLLLLIDKNKIIIATWRKVEQMEESLRISEHMVDIRYYYWFALSPLVFLLAVVTH